MEYAVGPKEGQTGPAEARAFESETKLVIEKSYSDSMG